MYVDETGRRFVDENLPWNAISEHILKLKSRRCWVITDAQSYKGATLSLKLINGIVRKAGSVREMAADEDPSDGARTNVRPIQSGG